LGVVGGLLISPSFQTYFHIDPNNKIHEAEINGNIVSVLQIGCLFGSLLATSTAGKVINIYIVIKYVVVTQLSKIKMPWVENIA
jgi:hypothetical protein